MINLFKAMKSMFEPKEKDKQLAKIVNKTSEFRDLDKEYKLGSGQLKKSNPESYIDENGKEYYMVGEKNNIRDVDIDIKKEKVLTVTLKHKNYTDYYQRIGELSMSYTKEDNFKESEYKIMAEYIGRLDDYNNGIISSQDIEDIMEDDYKLEPYSFIAAIDYMNNKDKGNH